MRSEESLDEEIELDPQVVARAFARGLRLGLTYLTKLEEKALADYELSGDEAEIQLCFQSLAKFVGARGTDGLTVEDLEDFGLPYSCLHRVKQLIVQLDNTSPVNRNVNKYYHEPETPPTPAEIAEELDEQYSQDDFDEFEEDIMSETKEIKESSSKSFEEDTIDVHQAEKQKPNPSKHRQQQPLQSQALPLPRPNTTDAVLPHPGLTLGTPRFDSVEPPVDLPARASTGGPSSKASVSESSRTSVSATKRKQKPVTWIAERRWVLGEKIGSGSFGEVFQCMNDKGKLFAVKRMDMVGRKEEVENLAREIQLMRGLTHPNIVEYIGATVDEDSVQVYIFQEWVPGGSVAHLLKRFGPFQLGVVRNYTRQIMLGLQYLHDNGIIHRDIKGGNILVTESGTVKLADFGASTTLTDFGKTQETRTIKGTPYFMAPEVLAKSRYGRKGDVWAVGCTMIQMLTGEPPWKDHNLAGLVQLHMLLESWTKGPPNYDESSATPEAKECLRLFFIKDEEQRPTVAQMLTCRFLQEDDYEDSLEYSNDPDVTAEGIEQVKFGDSGVLSGLKEQMVRAVTRASISGTSSATAESDDSPSRYINQRLEQRKARQVRSVADVENERSPKSEISTPSGVQSSPSVPTSNPFAKSNNNAARPRDVERRIFPTRSETPPKSNGSNFTASQSPQDRPHNPFGRGSNPGITANQRPPTSLPTTKPQSMSKLPIGSAAVASTGDDQEANLTPRSQLQMLKKVKNDAAEARQSTSAFKQPTARSQTSPGAARLSSQPSEYGAGEESEQPERDGMGRVVRQQPASRQDSQSARIHRPDPIVTSRQSRSARTSIETMKTQKSMQPTRQSYSQLTSGSGDPVQAYASSASTPELGLRDTDPDEPWICQNSKCLRENSNPEYCEFCATRRGATGSRGHGAAIPYNS